MKGCYVISKWVGTGKDDDPQRPLVADEYPCSCEDVTGQYVRLDKGSPGPNLAVFKVVELRSPKHDGKVDAIKKDSRFLVLEEWEVPVDGELQVAIKAVPDEDVKTYLVDKLVATAVADLVVGEYRVDRARKLFKDFERPPVIPVVIER